MKKQIIKQLEAYFKEFDESDSFTERAKLLMLIRSQTKMLIRVLEEE